MGLSLTVDGLEWSFDRGDPFLRVPRLTVAEGSLVTIVGPSGAGKSTLLFLLGGLDRPTKGTISWAGNALVGRTGAQSDRWRRRNLGLVFQDFQLVPELTALENVLLPVTFERFLVPSDTVRRARTLLDQVGVRRADARAATLSRGEMQRTALARALLGRPPVLLADEPTASLDAAHEAAVVDLLVACCRDLGTTVVVSTHQTGLQSAADRVLRLDHGRIVEAS